MHQGATGRLGIEKSWEAGGGGWGGWEEKVGILNPPLLPNFSSPLILLVSFGV